MSSRFAARGVFGLSRNPMYVGFAVLLVAWAVDLGAWVVLVGPLAFVAYITRFQIIPEERALESRFGQDYLQYRSRVRRWI